MNVVVLRGTLSRPPDTRVLGSGDLLVSYEVTVARPDGPADTAPVSWLAPPAGAEGFAAGEEVVVVGRVRRRFFRAGGAVQSRTEVVAAAVVPARQRKKAERAVAAALAPIGVCEPAQG